MPVLASDAGLAANKPVASDKPGERVEAETVVLTSTPVWVEHEAVSAGAPNETGGLPSAGLLLVTGVKEVVSGRPRET